MIKEDMVNKISNDTGLRRVVVALVIDQILKNITSALESGDKVQFAGFGTFETVKRAPRVGHNPHTRERVPIPARIVPVFTVGKSLKEAVTKECNDT